MDTRRPLTSILERVADQALEKLDQVRVVPGDNGQPIGGDIRLGFSDYRPAVSTVC